MEKKDSKLKTIFLSIKKGLKGYLKSQISIALISFLVLSISLDYIGIEYSIFKAMIISLVDLVPIIGSGIIMIPWAIYYFAIGSNTLALKIIIVYIVLVIIRQIVEPKIMGDSIGIKPLYMFILIIISTMIIGPLGIILAPIIAIIVSTVLKINKDSDNENKDDKIK